MRVSITKIEAMTGLDFGTTMRTADTILQSKQPKVGAEAMQAITALTDLKL